MLKHYVLYIVRSFALDDLRPHLCTLIMTTRLGNWQKLKEGMPLGNLSIVAFHATKVPTNLFSSTLIFLLTPDYKLIRKIIPTNIVFFF